MGCHRNVLNSSNVDGLLRLSGTGIYTNERKWNFSSNASCLLESRVLHSYIWRTLLWRSNGGEDGMGQGRKWRTDTYVKNTNAFDTQLCPTDLDSRLQGGWVRGHNVAPATGVTHSSPGVNESMTTICRSSIQQPSAVINQPREMCSGFIRQSHIHRVRVLADA